jgi:PAS domain S-box-containing protein
MAEPETEPWRRLRQALKELRARERERIQMSRRYFGLFQYAFGAIVITDQQGIIIAWNPAAEDILGWSAKEAIGQNVELLIVPPADRREHRAAIERFLRTGEPRIHGRREVVGVLCKDGVEIPVETSIWPIRGVGGSVEFGKIMFPIEKLVDLRDARGDFDRGSDSEQRK